MQFIQNKNETGSVVVLDDTSFVNCKFKNCQLLYSGGDYAWTNTMFENCQVGLQGAAGRTAALLNNFGWKPPQPGIAIPVPPTKTVN